jgi:hypothetical protein
MSVFSNRSADPPQERARYAGAILDLLGDNEPLTVLRQTPSAIAEAIDGVMPTQLRTPGRTRQVVRRPGAAASG